MGSLPFFVSTNQKLIKKVREPKELIHTVVWIVVPDVMTIQSQALIPSHQSSFAVSGVQSGQIANSNCDSLYIFWRSKHSYKLTFAKSEWLTRNFSKSHSLMQWYMLVNKWTLNEEKNKINPNKAIQNLNIFMDTKNMTLRTWPKKHLILSHEKSWQIKLAIYNGISRWNKLTNIYHGLISSQSMESIFPKYDWWVARNETRDKWAPIAFNELFKLSQQRYHLRDFGLTNMTTKDRSEAKTIGMRTCSAYCVDISIKSTTNKIVRIK